MPRPPARLGLVFAAVVVVDIDEDPDREGQYLDHTLGQPFAQTLRPLPGGAAGRE
jgi:hypothetical protein